MNELILLPVICTSPQLDRPPQILPPPLNFKRLKKKRTANIRSISEGRDRGEDSSGPKYLLRQIDLGQTNLGSRFDASRVSLRSLTVTHGSRAIRLCSARQTDLATHGAAALFPLASYIPALAAPPRRHLTSRVTDS